MFRTKYAILIGGQAHHCVIDQPETDVVSVPVPKDGGPLVSGKRPAHSTTRKYFRTKEWDVTGLTVFRAVQA